MTTKTISIHGEKFEVGTPYAEGAVLSATEARVLNQVRAENIANNYRKAVGEALEKPEGSDRDTALAAVRTAFAEYDVKYTFAMGGTARTPVDPVEREATNLAKAAIAAQLKEKGIKLKDYLATEGNQDKYDAAVEKLSTRDDFLKEAKKRVAARAKTTSADLSDLGL